MTDISKGRSPFYPGQPVPVELFTGRKEQIERIMIRGAGQVAAGKSVSMFVQGEYGIGKSSIAIYTQRLAEKEYGLHGIYATLGGCANMNDVVTRIVEATLRSGAMNARRGELVRNWLARYIGQQELFGFKLNLEALRTDAPSFTTPSGMLDFLGTALVRLQETTVKGIFLSLDEINGISSDPQFAHFIKGIVDVNAQSEAPVPLLLMLCGVAEKRKEMVERHPPIDRIFDIVNIAPMNDRETRDFFIRAFQSIQMNVEDDAAGQLAYWSAGFPKIMHEVGDAAYWLDQDGVIDAQDANRTVLIAAEEIGKKYVDQQVYRELTSSDYKSILKKIGNSLEQTIKRADIVQGLTETERKKLDNFLRRLEALKVIKKGEERGTYEFIQRMVRVYIWLRSSETANK